MVNGLSRLASRFNGEPARVDDLKRPRRPGSRRGRGARAPGSRRSRADDIDFEDELRIAIEERASLSPDALTGMEASLRFVGPETLETKIFGAALRLAELDLPRAQPVGPSTARSRSTASPSGRSEFDWRRT